MTGDFLIKLYLYNFIPSNVRRHSNQVQVGKIGAVSFVQDFWWRIREADRKPAKVLSSEYSKLEIDVYYISQIIIRCTTVVLAVPKRLEL